MREHFEVLLRNKKFTCCGGSRASKTRNSLSLSPSYSRSNLSYGRGYVMKLSRTLPTDFQRDTSRTNTKPGGFSFIPCQFEEINPNLETRASEEVGGDPPHYDGVA